MSINFEKSEVNENNELLMEITVDSKESKVAYAQACKKLSAYVNIPGFRKGKAPANVVEKHLGRDYIQREVLENLLPKKIHEFIISNKYELVMEPKITDFKFEEEVW